MEKSRKGRKEDQGKFLHGGDFPFFFSCAFNY